MSGGYRLAFIVAVVPVAAHRSQPWRIGCLPLIASTGNRKRPKGVTAVASGPGTVRRRAAVRRQSRPRTAGWARARRGGGPERRAVDDDDDVQVDEASFAFTRSDPEVRFAGAGVGLSRKTPDPTPALVDSNEDDPNSLTATAALTGAAARRGGAFVAGVQCGRPSGASTAASFEHASGSRLLDLEVGAAAELSARSSSAKRQPWAR